MNAVKRISLAVYIIFLIPAVAAVYYILAPTVARLSGLDPQITAWTLVVIAVLAGARIAVPIIRGERP